MTVSHDLRWRAVVLVYVYGISAAQTALLLGVGKSSVKRWLQLFYETGSIDPAQRPPKGKLTPEMKSFIEDYTRHHPCFYIQELQEEIKTRFPEFKHNSIPTLCRILRKDLNLTRKVLTARAREAAPKEIQEYFNRLAPFYSYPDQLVFVDETSKDARHAIRRYAWSNKGSPAVVNLPRSRGKRVSAIACMTTRGFKGWHFSEGTYDRMAFHQGFVKAVLPFLNPWPLPNSIVILDNAKIHMYPEIEEVVRLAGALLFYLPPYCPHLNPIEYGFGLMKAWVKKYANKGFVSNPQAVLNAAFTSCVTGDCVRTFLHCGYQYCNLKYLE